VRFTETRHPRGRESNEGRRAGERGGDAQASPERAEHEALREQAAHEARPARPERGSKRELRRALLRLHQLERGHVGTGDEQDEPGPGEEGEKGRARGAEHDLLEWSDDGRDPGRLVPVAVVPRGERSHVAPRLVQRDPGPETTDRAHPEDPRRLGEGGHTRQERRPQLGPGGVREPPWHHPHDRERLAVEHEGSADDAGVGAEAAEPQVVA
jgi:hypothetical protein